MAEHVSIGRPDFFHRLDVSMSRSLAGACEGALALITATSRAHSSGIFGEVLVRDVK